MRILFVEDHPETLESLSENLRDRVGADNVITATNRDEAFERIETSIFDFAILDLKIPASDAEVLDAQPEYGRQVFSMLKERQPGVPICFHTAFGDDDLIADLIEMSTQEDIWGAGDNLPMLALVTKRKPLKLLEKVEHLRALLEETENIYLDTGLPPVPMSDQDKRVVKIFVRRQQGVSAQVEKLTPGLSSSSVFRLRIADENGANVLHAIGKIGLTSETEVELRNYQQYIVSLPAGRYAGLVGDVSAGAGERSGIFYRYLDGADRSLFEILEEDQARSVSVVGGLTEIEAEWIEGRPVVERSIGDIRRLLVSNDSMANLQHGQQAAVVRDFEAQNVPVRWSTRHGDLHGANVLVQGENPWLIDFGRTQPGPASLDPVTLECSLIWHPDGRERCGGWPSEENCENWADIDAYVIDCPYADFVRRVREWSRAVTGSSREILACLYATSLRQLKYPDTNHDLARALIAHSISSFE